MFESIVFLFIYNKDEKLIVVYYDLEGHFLLNIEEK